MILNDKGENMTNALNTAMIYFDYSNNRDFEKIADMFTESSTYSSQNTGVYLGARDIMEMTKFFFNSHEKLFWNIHSVEEIRPGVVKFDFTLEARRNNGEEYTKPGIEYVIIFENKIQHVEVRNK